MLLSGVKELVRNQENIPLDQQRFLHKGPKPADDITLQVTALSVHVSDLMRSLALRTYTMQSKDRSLDAWLSLLCCTYHAVDLWTCPCASRVSYVDRKHDWCGCR